MSIFKPKKIKQSLKGGKIKANQPHLPTKLFLHADETKQQTTDQNTFGALRPDYHREEHRRASAANLAFRHLCWSLSVYPGQSAGPAPGQGHISTLRAPKGQLHQQLTAAPRWAAGTGLVCTLWGLGPRKHLLLLKGSKHHTEVERSTRSSSF